ncbi:MAG: adenylate/guanylate cyclase domain-containing protein, partial [Cyclobacteriaceae bacterium]
SILIYFFFFIFLMNFIVQVNKKFGPGVLFNLLRGKYYHPRKEHLILLFIDLKGSTTIAEQLGHEKYSQFIRECVHQLTPMLVEYQAKIYQYVGDEVVLYWKTEDVIGTLDYIDTFFDFKKRLDECKSDFENKYNVYPEFKAGMDCGEVTVTEIGDIKREIALHGDVLNTAARLEKICNDYGEWLLITENLVQNIENTNQYRVAYLDEILLKGKREKIKFFAVRIS